MAQIIAEIGVNFNDVDHFKQLIKDCISAGALLIKGQYFREKDIRKHPDYSILKTKVMDVELARELMEYAKRRGADLFWTPENAEVVDEVIDLEPKCIKIGHSNYSDCEMAKTCSMYIQPTIVSVPIGHMRSKENQNAVMEIAKKTWTKPDTIFMYCVPRYPPKLADINLGDYDSSALKGVSLHYDSIYPHLYAVWAGAKFVEVHVKDNENLLDSKVSITMSELKELVKESMNFEAMKGWHK